MAKAAVNSAGLSTLVFFLVTICVHLSAGRTITYGAANESLTEEDARNFLAEIEKPMSEQCNKVNLAEWAFASNITDENQQKSVDASLEYAKFQKEIWQNVVQYPWKNFKDQSVQRQIKALSILGTDALPQDELKNYTNIINKMQAVYSQAKICDFKNASDCSLALEPELTQKMAKSRNYEELEYIWIKWREVSGNKYRDQYPMYVELMNKAARENGFKDATEMWLDDFLDSTTFLQDVDILWEQVRPLYEQLHAYVRRILRQKYGASRIGKDEAIPAHLLGNMWAQTWGNILDITTPFPDEPNVDVTDAMIAQKYTPKRMFELSELFFTSIGMPKMTEAFWNNSIIEKPKDRDIVCHASAWDFCDGKDFRIKQCTEVTMADLIVVHHEMGHITYFQQYKDQPKAFREGANSGFHEAVGDTLALSVSTLKHLKTIGLLHTNVTENEALAINFLFSQALDKVAFLPFGLLIDKFRWDIFSGKVTPEQYNCHWWKLRFQYQGLRPPVPRKSTDFDAGAKYHIAASVPYIRYFVSHILQFQFHRALCIAAGQYDPDDSQKPLHECDIYQNKAAGEKLSAMLKLGASKPWPEALEMITGQRKMDATALLEYYKPLFDYLRIENARAYEPIGWKETDEPICINT